MSKTCKNCGNTFEDHMNICPRCGMQYVADATPQYSDTQPGNYAQNTNPYQQPYTQQGYGQQGYQQPVYQAYPVVPPVTEQMTVGNWVATILVTNLPFFGIGLIMLFVWAFSSNVPLAKKNYCRAMLIFKAIAVGLVILLFIILAAAGTSLIGAIEEAFSEI